jgi:hypothetical protein
VGGDLVLINKRFVIVDTLGSWGDREWEVGKDRSGWSRGGDDGDGGFSDRWQEVFNGDISKGDSFDNFFELVVDVSVLLFGDRRVLKLGAYNVSLLDGDIGEDVEEVGQGGDDGGRERGAIGVKVHGGVIATWARVIPGIVGAIQVLLDDLVGGGDIDLVGVVDLRPVGNRKGGGDNKGR